MKFFDTDAFYIKKPETNKKVNLKRLAAWNLDLNNLDEELMQNLHGAVQNNMLDQVQLAVKAHVPLDSINSTGHSILTLAATCGAKEVVGYLLDLGLNAAYRDKGKMAFNAYQAACAAGQFDIACLILDHKSQKIDVDMVDGQYLQTGLQMAVVNHQFDCVLKLIERYKPDIHQPDQRGRTLLATTLGAFVRLEFETDILVNKKQASLTSFCKKMLQKENAFKQTSPKARAAIEVILTSNLALNAPIGEVSEKYIAAEDVILTMLIECPEVATILYQQAQENPAGLFENKFITHYKNSELRYLDKKERAQLISLQKEAQRNSPSM